jgi:hypothetical protein
VKHGDPVVMQPVLDEPDTLTINARLVALRLGMVRHVD